MNTLNPQRTAMVVADFVKLGHVSSPADLRYRENLLFPGRLIEDAGSVRVGRPLHQVMSPSKLNQWKEMFPEEKFLLILSKNQVGKEETCGFDMILEKNASGEDALRGWLVSAYAAEAAERGGQSELSILQESYEKMNDVYSPFLSQLHAKGWHTDRFLDGAGLRFAWS